MSDKQPPPLGKDRDDARLCQRLVGHDENGERVCGAVAVMHVIYHWDVGESVDWNHGFCCQRHWDEYQRRWRYAFAHAMTPACGMPGSIVSRDENTCFYDDLPTAEPVRAIAETVAA